MSCSFHMATGPLMVASHAYRNGVKTACHSRNMGLVRFGRGNMRYAQHPALSPCDSAGRILDEMVLVSCPVFEISWEIFVILRRCRFIF